MSKYIIGCSYVEEMPLDIFEGYTRIGMSGCDNTSIYNKVLSLHQQKNIENLFIIFTGLFRTSYSISTNLHSLFSKYEYKTQNNDEIRIFSGGNYGSWTVKRSLKSLFKLAYCDSDLSHIKQNSLISCLSCLNYLKINSIPYKYTFAYNPISIDNFDEVNWGSIDKENYYWNLLDKQYFIDKYFLYDYAKVTNLLSDDNYHPSIKAYQNWYHIIREMI